jgi:hypothetical protein
MSQTSKNWGTMSQRFIGGIHGDNDFRRKCLNESGIKVGEIKFLVSVVSKVLLVYGIVGDTSKLRGCLGVRCIN